MNKKEFVGIFFSKKTICKYDKKIKSLGSKCKYNAYDFLFYKFISTLTIFILLLWLFDFGYILSPIITYIYCFYFYNYYFLDRKIKKRTILLENEAIQFFEVLTLSIDTGRNLSGGLEVTTNNVSGELSREFKETLREVTFGKSLVEAVNDMQERIPSESINNIILSLNQANFYGNNVIDNLYQQVDYLREKRKMAVKAKISNLPIKINRINQQSKLDYIKDPMILEFLRLSENNTYLESDVEKAIISHLQKFLMELGKGYAFVARQQRIHTEKEDYFIDLVFYNYILKCFVLIDLKTSKITHQDVEQMDMYIRMYDELKKASDDNPTLGIVLCSDTDEDIAKYSILKGNEQLFASKYKLYLPTESELRNEIVKEKNFYLEKIKK